MHHRFLDSYAEQEGFLQKLDGRVKIAAVGLIVLFVVFTSPHAFLRFAGYAVLIGILIFLSRIPLIVVGQRVLTLLPFILLVAAFIPFVKKGRVIGGYSLGVIKLTLTHDGLTVFWNVLIKSLLTTVSIFVLIATTRHARLLQGLQKMGCPRIMVMILAFMYRYVFVLEDELEIMRQAKASRTVGGSRWFHNRALANILGNLFIRSYERGEAVYLAMQSRGFDGRVRLWDYTRFGLKDGLFLLILTILLLAIRWLPFFHG